MIDTYVVLNLAKYIYLKRKTLKDDLTMYYFLRLASVGTCVDWFTCEYFGYIDTG